MTAPREDAPPAAGRPGDRPGAAKRLRMRLRGVATVLGLGRWGFYTPYRYAAGVEPPAGTPAYPALEALFSGRREAFAAVLAEVDGLAPALEGFAGARPPAPRWEQDWFPHLDGAVAYALVRRHRPARIVEVGSGHSTRFLARAAKDAGAATRITAIDPAPRADIADLGVAVVRDPVERAGTAPFRDLAAGDVLFIDSSHIVVPGGDLDFLVNAVLPVLPAGVWVHFHDIFLPDGYPPSWAWRNYNEQQLVGALIAGGGYELVFASHFVATRMAAEVAATVVGRLPGRRGGLESSLWLRKTVPAVAPGLTEK